MNKLKRIWKILIFLPRWPVLYLIRFYQYTLSPDHGPLKSLWGAGVCRFYPTCSDYGYQVIKKRGLLIGLPLTFWRILRCNPWNQGGEDLP